MKTGRKVYPKRPLSGAAACKRCLWTLLLGLSVLSCTVQGEVLRVILLGTGGPPPDPKRSGPGVLIEAGQQRLLFDAGRGVVERLTQAGVELPTVGPVFLTHLHYDHTVGLADLWLTGWVWQREGGLEVFGPAGTADSAGHLRQAFDFDIQARARDAKLDPASARIRVVDIKPGEIYAHDKLKVRAFEVDHGPVKPAYGYRIDFGDHSVVISGDTRYAPQLVEAAKGVDLLIHEVTAAPAALVKQNARLEQVMNYHSSPADTARVFSETKPKMAVFTHVLLFGGMAGQQLIDQVREAGYAGPLEVGEDLMWFDVGEKVTMRRSIAGTATNK